MNELAALRAVKDRAAERLMWTPGVTGVGIGGRRRAGRPTGELVIKVYVTRKLAAAEVAAERLIPLEFEGIRTDVESMGSVKLRGGPTEPEEEIVTQMPLGTPFAPVVRADLSRRRPLVGGCAIQTDLTGSPIGTLGCLLVHATDETKVYALTTFHVAGLSGAGGATAVAGVTRIGQPQAKGSSTACCSAMIGHYAGGGSDATRDAAVVQLDPGMSWKAVIQGAGPVRGTDTITLEQAASGTYRVRKSGCRTTVTGGIVESIETSVGTGPNAIRNAIITAPEPHPLVPEGTVIYFAQESDSGSVLLNDANKIVGLLFGAADAPSPGKAGSIPIDVVLARFAEVEQLPLVVPTAVDTETVHTVPGGSPAGLAAGLPRHVQADLDSSPAGRALVTMWLSHQTELVDLVQRNRRVTVAWHRNGGPALAQTAIRMPDAPELRLPSTVDGLNSIADTIDRFASPALRADLARVRRALPDPAVLAGLTYPGLVDALQAVSAIGEEVDR